MPDLKGKTMCIKGVVPISNAKSTLVKVRSYMEESYQNVRISSSRCQSVKTFIRELFLDIYAEYRVSVVPGYFGDCALHDKNV